jgi:hypothetical protein
MNIIGIDGGSTKIEFALASADSIIQTIRYETPTNLKYVGADAVIAALEKGFLDIDISDLAGVYLGIAECGPISNILGRDKIVQYLHTRLGGLPFVLDDDQYPVFRSLSPTPFGVLANAGTGSNINLFNKEGACTIKSVSYGGRDFGKALVTLCARGAFEESSQLYIAIKNHIGMDPKLWYAQLSGHDFVINTVITSLPAAIRDLYESDTVTRNTLSTLIWTMGSRWGSKLGSYCMTNFGIGIDQPFDVVLRGGLWNWTEIYDICALEMKKTFTNVNIIIDNSVPAVLGDVRLAREIFLNTSLTK